MTRYAIRHETRYAYGAPVDLSFHLLRLTPPNNKRQALLAHALEVEPQPARIGTFHDHFGNAVHHVAIESVHEALSVTVEAQVDIKPAADPLLADGPDWEAVRAAVMDDGFPARPRIAEFVYASPLAPPEPGAVAYARESFPAGRPIVEGLCDLTRRIRQDFAYKPGSTDVTTPIAQVMAERRGVCQDFAHAMIAGLRGLGLPTRYVSGYIRTYPPQDRTAWRGADASHAWVSSWCGTELGWIGFDPTNNLVVDDEHISIAHGRDFSDVTPLRGVILGGGAHALEVAVTVTPLDAAERVRPKAS